MEDERRVKLILADMVELMSDLSVSFSNSLDLPCFNHTVQRYLSNPLPLF
jgi:hypothetical protein